MMLSRLITRRAAYMGGAFAAFTAAYSFNQHTSNMSSHNQSQQAQSQSSNFYTTSAMSSTRVNQQQQQQEDEERQSYRQWRHEFHRQSRFSWGMMSLAGTATLSFVLSAACDGGDDTKKSAGNTDWKQIRAEIAALLDDPNYDDGSYGPLFVRLAWHAAGTFDKASGTGGSNGATMRFTPESDWGANRGLALARSRLEGIKQRHPEISYADLWTLAGVVAIEEMGGPQIPWRPIRTDAKQEVHKPLPDGRLPDASKDHTHVRDVFYRMGFNDQDIVALLGAHALGRCHTDRSGYEGPWTNAPTTFSNDYFVRLLQENWTKRAWNGPLQFENADRTLMMTPADLALLKDEKFRKFVELYAKDEAKFFNDFASAFSRLLELGVPTVGH